MKIFMIYISLVLSFTLFTQSLKKKTKIRKKMQKKVDENKKAMLR